MTNQILDEDFTQKEKNPKGKSWKNWLIIGIFWVGIAVYFVSDGFVDIRLLLSTIALISITFLTYKDFENGVKLTMGIIILASFRLLIFVPYESSFSFSIGPLSIVFDILIILLGVVHYSLNESILSPLLKKIRKRREQKQQKNLKAKQLKSQTKQQQEKNSKINRFKHQFHNRNLDELNEIVNNERLLPEAIAAAQELIQEKSIS